MAVVALAKAAVRVYSLVLVAHIVLSWLPPDRRENDVCRFLSALSEPVLNPLRRVIPPVGGLDLSPVAAFIALQMIAALLPG